MTREEEIRQEIALRVAGGFGDYIDGYEEGFIAGAKWADKTQIEKVLKFIFEYFYEHPHVNGHICTDSFESLEELEEELIKAMEE